MTLWGIPYPAVTDNNVRFFDNLLSSFGACGGGGGGNGCGGSGAEPDLIIFWKLTKGGSKK
jgi:hypothetical protein